MTDGYTPKNSTDVKMKALLNDELHELYQTHRRQRTDQLVKQLARRAGDKACTLSQLALAWILHQPGITGAIIGPRTWDHFSDLLPATEVHLDRSDLEFCDTLVPPGMNVSDHFNTSRWKPE